ncbi:MAG: M48 family metalloprotease [Desulfobacterales bacterium]|nr:M48 family metalloprotease [Desulfobacterales bacterium]
MTEESRTEYWTRREFIAAGALAAAGVVVGCAANPVTGQSQLMLMSREQEIALDRQHSPQQFSADYGTVQDRALNAYIDETGKRIAGQTHRPDMPYSFRVVNATYVNAYAFPGGSIAATRGILLKLDNEAELASLLGHELGHVNARHTAQQMSKGTLAQILVGGLAAYAGSQGQIYGTLASSLGMVGAGALLASYSRDNEREADDLGMRYMVRSGYSPDGFVGLMEMLDAMNRHNASAFDLMFATHPMSRERYDTAVAQAAAYAEAKKNPLYRERYMDRTSRLRAKAGAIENMQKAETAMAKKNYSEAETLLKSALKEAPDDYAGLVMMSKVQLALKNPEAADRYAEKAKAVYPDEAQGHYLSGFASLQKKDYDAARADFARYEKLLPGNPNAVFYQGLSLEGMGRRKDAASTYYRFLQMTREGDQAQYAYSRLVEWGVVK